jgi:hypothetical protein
MRLVPSPRFLAVLFLVVAPAFVLAQSTLIPLTTRRDMVFDRTGSYLFITTSDGWVRRYNLGTGQLEPGYNVGGALNGLDISPDNSFLLVAQDFVSGSQGIFHRIDLATGSVTNIIYARNGAEAGAWDVAIASNGLALATTRLPDFYSGWTPLRQIDLTTNTASVRTDTPHPPHLSRDVSNRTQIHRSADGSRLYLLEAGLSSGPVFTYSSATNSFGGYADAQMYFDTAAAAVNRNGTLLGTLVGVQYPFGYSKPTAAVDSAPELQFRRGFGELDSGIAFDAVADVFYGVSSTAGQIIAYDTNTFAEKFRLNIGEPLQKMIAVFGSGTLVASNDGRYLALATPSGVRLFSVSTGTPSPPPVPSFTTRRDMVFDHSGQYLYLTTDNGLVERFHLGNGTLEIVANLGGKLNGADIAPDDSYLLVAQDNIGVAQGMWQKVDLVTGQVTAINFARDHSEGGAWDVAIGSDGLGLLTTKVPDGFSASTPLRQINLLTNALSTRTDIPPFVGLSGGRSMVSGGTHISRSADGTRFYFLESNVSTGWVFTYNAVSNTFGSLAASNSFLDSSSAAVNRNGSLVATRHGYPNSASLDTAPDFDFVQPFTFDGGVAFDAISDTLYGVDRSRSEVIAYDTNTGAEKYRFTIGENVSPPIPTPGGPGPYTPELGYVKLVASNDGRYLALQTPLGFRLYDLPSVAKTPAPDPVYGAVRALVFDHAGNYLYLGTATGFIWPYNLLTGKLEIPYDLGGSLGGLDIAPDDSCLLVAQQKTGLAGGHFKKLELATGKIRNIPYKGPEGGGEVGWDVAIAANGLGFGTTSGGTLRQLDLKTGVASARLDAPGAFGSGRLTGLAEIRRSADGAVLTFLERSIGGLPIFNYTVSSNTFGPSWNSNAGFDVGIALNRDGSLLGLRQGVADLLSLPGFNFLRQFADLNHAIAFDAVRDVFYGVNTATDEIIGYDTASYSVAARFAIGEDIPSIPKPGGFGENFATSPNGRYLAFLTPTAVRIYDLTNQTARSISTLPRLGNISTRAVVGIGDNVPIAGFIVVGSDAKKVVLRAIGPSLAGLGVTGPVADPTLTLHDSTGAVMAFNDNWEQSQRSEIQLSGLAPANGLEAVIIRTLPPGSYTAVMRGNHNATGIGLVEVYDVEPNADSKLGNISTRGFIGTNDELMIAGLIINSAANESPMPTRSVLVRGLGPSLANFNVPQVLADPLLEIRSANGSIVQANDNWRIPQQNSIEATGLAPRDDRESAVIVSLAPGNYTAIARGVNGTIGAGLVEVYSLQ